MKKILLGVGVVVLFCSGLIACGSTATSSGTTSGSTSTLAPSVGKMVEIDKWQITLHSYKIDGTYLQNLDTLITRQVPNGKTLLVVHVIVKNVGRVGRVIQDGDFDLTDTATGEVSGHENVGQYGINSPNLTGHVVEGDMVFDVQSKTASR